MPPRTGIEPAENGNKTGLDKKKDIAVIVTKPGKQIHGGEDTIKRTRLLRINDLLAQSSTETLLDMLRANSGIKECSDETVAHINGVSRRFLKLGVM